MPTDRPTRCPYDGCRALTTRRGRCDEHQIKPWANPSANTRALTSRERARFREEVLAGEPSCACTGWCNQHRGPCPEPGTQADHIISIAMGGSRLARANGQPLCAGCHTVKTRLDTAAVKAARKKAHHGR